MGRSQAWRPMQKQRCSSIANNDFFRSDHISQNLASAASEHNYPQSSCGGCRKSSSDSEVHCQVVGKRNKLHPSLAMRSGRHRFVMAFISCSPGVNSIRIWSCENHVTIHWEYMWPTLVSLAVTRKWCQRASFSFGTFIQFGNSHRSSNLLKNVHTQ